jgi:2-phosphoglycerate kinase
MAEFFTQLSAETIQTLLQHHHQNMWPGIQRFIKDQCDTDAPFVLEGCALRPAHLRSHAANTLCLIAEPEILRQRILDGSRYDQQVPALRQQIDAFITRSLNDNAAILAEARAHDIRCIDVTDLNTLSAYQRSFIASQRNANPRK